MSSTSYCTVTGAVRPGIVALVIVAGPDTITTCAVSLSAVAVNVDVSVPGGGLYVTCRPVAFDSEPPPSVLHVTSAVVFVRIAVSSTGPAVCTVPEGLMDSAGWPGLSEAHAATKTTRTQPIAERITTSGRNQFPRRASRVPART